MGRAGGGGGGGHSSGGHSSGGHSSGSHSMSHSRAGGGGGGFSHSSHSRAGGGFGGGGFHGGPGHGPGGFHGGPGMPPPRHHGYAYGAYRPIYRPSVANRVLTWTVTLIIMFVIIGLSAARYGGNITKSTHDREKLTEVASFDSDCVVDELSWFDNANSAGSKLKYFYQETGVQPYVYLLSYNASLTTIDQKTTYAESLFDSEGLADNAFLFVYFAEEDTDNDVGDMVYVSGTRVDSVMDSEAVDIFWDYIDNYWYTSMSTDDMFEAVFTKTADRIMTKTTTFADVGKIAAIGGVLIIAIGGAIIIMVTKRKHEKEKAEETERILNTPMQDLTQTSKTDDLVNKYK